MQSGGAGPAQIPWRTGVSFLVISLASTHGGHVLCSPSLPHETAMTAHSVFRFESGPEIMRIESCFLFQEAHEEFGVANRYS
jgi:hypothetical protein